MILEDYNMNEKIGLSNIRIEHNHWMYPTVTMDIIDVNGHGLNGMENINNYSNNKQIRKGNSLFESFFTMPYPLFKLTVKGYLGESITYHLTVENVKIKLNDSVGNFTLNVKFIGSIYGELSDIPMHFLILAPYLIGKKSDIGTLSHGGTMYTLKELNNKLKNYTIKANNYLNESEGLNLNSQKNETFIKKSKLEDLLNKVSNLEQTFKNDAKTLQNNKFTHDAGEVRINAPYWDTEEDKKYKYVWIPYYTVGITYLTESQEDEGNIAVGRNYIERYKYLKLLYDYIKPKINEINDEINTLISNAGVKYEILEEGDELVAEKNEDWEKKHPNQYYRFVGYYFNKNVIEVIRNELKNCDTEIQNIEKNLSSNLSNLLSNSLGFPFSVGNFMEIICGHLKCFYDLMNDTCTKIKKQESKRKYNINNVIINGKKNSVGNATIPPFPSITNGNEELWFDEVGLSHFCERELVVNTYNTILEWSLNELKEAHDASWQERLSYVPSEGFPTLYGDMSETQRKNPYEGVNSIEDIVNVFKKRSIVRTITCNDSLNIDGNISDKLFGELEALTVLKSISNKDNLIENLANPDYTNSDLDEQFLNSLKGLGNKIDLTKFYPVLVYSEYSNKSWSEFSETPNTDKASVVPNFLTDEYYGDEQILFNDKVYFEDDKIPVNSSNQTLRENASKFDIDVDEYEKILPDKGNYPWYEGWMPRNSAHISEGEEMKELLVNEYTMDGRLFGLCHVTETSDKFVCKDFIYPQNLGFSTFVSTVLGKDLKGYRLGNISFDVGWRGICGFEGAGSENSASTDIIPFSKFMINDFQDAIKNFKKEVAIIKFMESLTGTGFLKECGDGPLGFKRIHPLVMATYGARCKVYKEVYDKKYNEIVSNQDLSDDTKKSELFKSRKNLKDVTGVKYYQAYSDFADKAIAYWDHVSETYYNDIKQFNGKDKDMWKFTDERSVRLKKILKNDNPINVFAIANKTLRSSPNFDKETHEGYVTDSVLSAVDVENLKGDRLFYKIDATASFHKKLTDLCKQRSEDLKKIKSQQSQLQVNANKNDIYKAIYKTYKQLYDRWKVGTKPARFDYNNMRIVNHFYEDISQQFMVNILDFDIYKGITLDENDISVISYIYEMFASFGFQTIMLPSNIGNEDISTIFKVIPYNGFKLDDRPTLVSVYAQYESEKIYDNEYENNDGIDYTNFTVSKGGANQIFGVTYGYDKQTIFNRIEVGSDKPKVTAHSIKAQMNISELGNPETAKTGMQFNNKLYPVYTNNSYECRVSMIGCAQMFPTLLFMLNNVPLFKGIYLITSVSHDIRGNVMTTSFSGTKVTWKRPKFVFQSGLNALYSAPSDDSSDNSSGNISGEWKLASEADKQKAAADKRGIIDLKNIPQGATDEYTGGYTLKDTYIVINPGHGYTQKHSGKQSSLFEYGNASGVFEEYQDNDGNLSDVYQSIDQYTKESVVDEQNYKTRLREYWLNRKMSLALKEELIKLGVPGEHIVFERNDVDSKYADSAGSSNKMESYYSKDKKAIVISMHHNASGNGSFNNTKYWCVFAQYPTYIHNEGDYVNIKNPEASFNIAKSLIKEMQNSGIVELGKIQSNPKVYTYKKSHSHPLSNVNNCPTIMIEGGFYTNLDMVKWYAKSTNRTKIAKVYAQGIVNFLNDN